MIRTEIKRASCHHKRYYLQKANLGLHPSSRAGVGSKKPPPLLGSRGALHYQSSPRIFYIILRGNLSRTGRSDIAFLSLFSLLYHGQKIQPMDWTVRYPLYVAILIPRFGRSK